MLFTPRRFADFAATWPLSPLLIDTAYRHISLRCHSRLPLYGERLRVVSRLLFRLRCAAVYARCRHAFFARFFFFHADAFILPL